MGISARLGLRIVHHAPIQAQVWLKTRPLRGDHTLPSYGAWAGHVPQFGESPALPTMSEDQTAQSSRIYGRIKGVKNLRLLGGEALVGLSQPLFQEVFGGVQGGPQALQRPLPGRHHPPQLLDLHPPMS